MKTNRRIVYRRLDGEIVCLASDGRSKFYDLMFRREWPSRTELS